MGQKSDIESGTARPENSSGYYVVVPVSSEVRQPAGMRSDFVWAMDERNLLNFRSRVWRPAGALVLSAALFCLAIFWFGGAKTSDLPLSRGNVGADSQFYEHEECGNYEEHVDFTGMKDLYHLDHFRSAKECLSKCDAESRCSSWTWGSMRPVEGLTDRCFLKELVPHVKPRKVQRYAVTSGLRTGVTCENMVTARDEKITISGHLHSKEGFCLDAPEKKKIDGRLQMWTCAPDNANQVWNYEAATGAMKSKDGLCLNAPNRNKPYVNVGMYTCDPKNWSQQWTYDEPTGLIKNWRGACLDAGERNIDGGMLYVQTCDVSNVNQRWIAGDPGQPTPIKTVPEGSLYCFALMLPGTYEQDLLAMQYNSKVSIFGCNEYAVYSNVVIEVAPGLNSSVVDSDLKCGKGGEFGTALNLDIFIAVWTQVIQEHRFDLHDWTAKADPDAVFVPDRLRKVLQIHPEAAEGVYLNNCKFGMHGPIEVFSRNAVRKWAAGSTQCVTHFQKQCGGDCFWGEDLFVDQCLWKVLGVRRDNDFRLLVEDHCEPPDGWQSCTDTQKVSFHPFKTLVGYQACLNAIVTGVPAPVPATTTTAKPPPSQVERKSTGMRGTTSNSEGSHVDEHEGCHTAEEHDDCYKDVLWAQHDGFDLHKDWYPGLSKKSSFIDFQAALHDNPHTACPKPCGLASN